MPTSPDNLDDPLNGAEEIGRYAGFVDQRGNVKLRKVYHALEKGYFDASKFGRQWISTRRRIRRAFTGDAA